MSVRDWLRGLFAAPARIDDGGDPEADADLAEEYSVPDAGEADVKAVAESGRPYAAQEAAETAEEDLETEQAPADPDS